MLSLHEVRALIGQCSLNGGTSKSRSSNPAGDAVRPWTCQRSTSDPYQRHIRASGPTQSKPKPSNTASSTTRREEKIPSFPHQPIPLPRQPSLSTLNPIPLPNLPQNPRRPTPNNTPTRHNHPRRHNGTIQNNREILQNRHPAQHHLFPDMHIVPHARGLDDRTLAHKDMVANFQRVVRVHSAVEARWRAQDGLFGDVAVAADVDCY